MAISFAQVSADALTLSREERERLAGRLLESIATAEDGAPLGATWEEVRRRIREAEDGAEKVSAEEVFAELREKYG